MSLLCWCFTNCCECGFGWGICIVVVACIVAIIVITCKICMVLKVKMEYDKIKAEKAGKMTPTTMEILSNAYEKIFQQSREEKSKLEQSGQ